MQVSCAENHLSRTINIYQEIKDEFSKDINDHWMIYFHQSHSDTILHQFLQFLSTLYQELLEDCSSHDFNLLNRKSYLNEMKFVRLSLIIWRDVWLRLLYYVTLIKLVRLFLKSTHSTTSIMKFSLNMMMKKYYIQLFFIARTCFLLNAITRYMIKNFWSSFKHLNTDDLNWS